jgi:hypothetical protein
VHLRNPKIFAVLVVAVVIGAYFVSCSMQQPKNTTQLENDCLGINVHSLTLNEARVVNESGASWIRIDASEGFSDFGASVQNAKKYNLSVLAILDSWMFNKSTVFNLDEWRGNVTYYVSRYAAYVDAWEIWNEPANPTYPLQNLSPKNPENMTKIVNFYYSMAQTACPIIRQHDQTAKILLFGGLNLYSGSDIHLEFDENFSRQLFAIGIEQYGDAISVHAYPWGSVQPQVWGSYASSLAYYKGLFTNKSFEVWVTESGQPVEVSGESGQAQYMKDALAFFGGNVNAVFWYSLVDNSWELEQANPQSFGLVGNETIPQASFRALQNFAWSRVREAI